MSGSRIRRRWFFLMFACSTGAANAGPFGFTKVVDSTDGYGGLFHVPAVNRSGTVAIIADASKILTWSNGTVTPQTTFPRTGCTPPSINDAGQIAYGRHLSVYRLTGGQEVPIYAGSGLFADRWNTAIANDGTVHITPLIQYVDMLYGKGSGGPVTPAVSQPVSFPKVSRPAVAANGTGVASTITDAPSRNYSAVYRDDGTTAMDSNTSFGSLAPDFRDDWFVEVDTDSTGDIVFTSARSNATQYRLYRLSNGAVTPVGIGLPTTASAIIPAINDNGIVAALAISGPVETIRAGFGDTTDPVVSVGDAFMGSTITGLAFQHDGLGEGNQLAFYASLADGRQGIYITTVPEPGALALIGLAAVAPLLRRRRS
jgi:hypothetical protein